MYMNSRHGFVWPTCRSTFISNFIHIIVTIQTIRIHIAAIDYMSMFYYCFNRKRVNFEKNTFRGEQNNSIDMYVGKTF